jgi:hypothetical protein
VDFVPVRTRPSAILQAGSCFAMLSAVIRNWTLLDDAFRFPRQKSNCLATPQQHKVPRAHEQFHIKTNNEVFIRGIFFWGLQESASCM